KERLQLKCYIHDLATLSCYEFQIKILDNIVLIEKTDKQILSFCNTTKKWVYELKNANILALIHLWSRIYQIQDSVTKQRGLGKLRTHLCKRTGLSSLPTYNLTLPYTEEVSKKSIKTLSRKIVHAILPLEVAEMLSKDTKIVYKNRPSIAHVRKQYENKSGPRQPTTMPGIAVLHRKDPLLKKNTPKNGTIANSDRYQCKHSSPTRQKFGKERPLQGSRIRGHTLGDTCKNNKIPKKTRQCTG